MAGVEGAALADLVEHQLGFAEGEIGEAFLGALVADGEAEEVAVEGEARGAVADGELGDQRVGSRGAGEAGGELGGAGVVELGEEHVRHGEGVAGGEGLERGDGVGRPVGGVEVEGGEHGVGGVGQEGAAEDRIEADQVEGEAGDCGGAGGSVLIAVQGAADCRYSLPTTQMARSSWAALRSSIASIAAS